MARGVRLESLDADGWLLFRRIPLRGVAEDGVALRLVEASPNVVGWMTPGDPRFATMLLSGRSSAETSEADSTAKRIMSV